MHQFFSSDTLWKARQLQSSENRDLLSGHLKPQLISMQTLPHTSIGSSSEIKLFSFPLLIIPVYNDVHYITLYFLNDEVTTKSISGETDKFISNK